MYQNDPRLKKIAADISMPSPKKRIQLENLHGASFSFVATAIWQLSEANHVFILNDREEAAYFLNDLENLTRALDICYFPDSFKRTGSFNELNSSHIMLRTEALTKFSGSKTRRKVLVSFPEALFEK